MEKKSTSSPDFIGKLTRLAAEGSVPEKFKHIIEQFYQSYQQALAENGLRIEEYAGVLNDFLEVIQGQFHTPFAFQPYHQQILEPFDYYTFGLNFFRPLIDISASSVLGLSYADEIASHLKAGHNVILLANHQTEAEPQAISVLLEKTHPKLAAELIFVAGGRVITDPLAIPFSMGRNLLCIHSKRYIDHPPEQKLEKQLHNKRTMGLMSELLSEGGKAIYVAPSGGRDRPNAQGVVEVAPFDPQSIEMFYLMAQKASHPTYFYTLALKTYGLLPPPQTIQVELGETRLAKRGGLHLAFGPRIDMENFPGSGQKDKHARRQARADFIWEQVKQDYSKFAGAT